MHSQNLNSCSGVELIVAPKPRFQPLPRANPSGAGADPNVTDANPRSVENGALQNAGSLPKGSKDVEDQDAMSKDEAGQHRKIWLRLQVGATDWAFSLRFDRSYLMA